MSLGLRTFDALHTPSAEAGGADCLLTTDDRYLKFCQRNPAVIFLPVQNPLIWLSRNVP